MNGSAGTRDSLDPSITIIKQTIQRLEEERTDLQQKLNVLQASTRDLPPEILAHIFLLVSGGCDGRHSRRTCLLFPRRDEHGDDRGQRAPLQLAAVCSLWRRVTFSTPHLWSSLTFHIYPGVDTSTGRQNLVNLLQQYLANVGMVPFSLDLHFDIPICNRPELGFFRPSTEILDLFSSVLSCEVNVRKVHGLKIFYAPFKWITSLPKFPNLESLTIHGSTGYADRILVLPLINLPRLHNIVFYDLYSRGLQRELVPSNVERTQITHISLAHVQVDVCVSLLVLCPNVTHFESTNPTFTDIEDIDLQAFELVGDPIVLHQLEHFGWTHLSPPDTFIRTYRRLRFPVLHTFRWYATGSPDLDHSALQALLPNLPNTIFRLEVLLVTEWPMSLVELMFVHGVTARDLRLDRCDYITMSNMIVALGRKGVGGGGVYLPQLEKMSIEGIGMDDDLGEWEDNGEVTMVDHIVDTLRSRCRPPSTGFILELSRYHGVWTDEMREAYWLLREEGHAGLKVWVDNEKQLDCKTLPGG